MMGVIVHFPSSVGIILRVFSPPFLLCLGEFYDCPNGRGHSEKLIFTFRGIRGMKRRGMNEGTKCKYKLARGGRREEGNE
jgi:hypothetical protein